MQPKIDPIAAAFSRLFDLKGPEAITKSTIHDLYILGSKSDDDSIEEELRISPLVTYAETMEYVSRFPSVLNSTLLYADCEVVFANKQKTLAMFILTHNSRSIGVGSSGYYEACMRQGNIEFPHPLNNQISLWHVKQLKDDFYKNPFITEKDISDAISSCGLAIMYEDPFAFLKDPYDLDRSAYDRTHAKLPIYKCITLLRLADYAECSMTHTKKEAYTAVKLKTKSKEKTISVGRNYDNAHICRFLKMIGKDPNPILMDLNI